MLKTCPYTGKTYMAPNRYFGTVKVKMPWPSSESLTAEQFITVLKEYNPRFDGKLEDFVPADVMQFKNWPKQKEFTLRFADTRTHAKNTKIVLSVYVGEKPKPVVLS